jgi:hypothetical protein
VRKLLPWALLGVLGVGVAVAAVLGQVQSPVASSTNNWLANLLATTAAAGSAHLRISSVALSADPAERSSSVATGVIDFTTGNFRLNQVNHEISFASTNGGAPQPVPYNWGETEIAIGQSLYEKDFVTVSNISSSPLPTTWNKYINPRNVHQAFGLDAGTAAENAVSGLSGILPVTSMRSLGPATVNGVSTTRYVLTYGAPELCGSRSFLLSQAGGGGARGRSASAAKAYEPVERPTTVWVDGQGRLVQVRASTFTSAKELKSVGTFSTASLTNVTTLTFSDFGAPVRIVAPDFTGPQPRAFNVGGKPSTACVH